jgi:hypothetical protein
MKTTVLKNLGNSLSTHSGFFLSASPTDREVESSELCDRGVNRDKSSTEIAGLSGELAEANSSSLDMLSWGEKYRQ